MLLQHCILHKRHTRKPHPKMGFQCERRESNPHSLGHKILSLARLPIPPLSQNTSLLTKSLYTVKSDKHFVLELYFVGFS